MDKSICYSPGIGIEGISVILDSSNITDVIKQFGDEYLISTMTLAIIGLGFLKRKEKEINLTEFLRMDEMPKSNVQLNTCRGCFYGVKEKISDVLNDKSLKSIYKSFHQTGFFKY